MAETHEDEAGPLRRVAAGVFRDIRAGLIGLAIASASALAVVLRKHHVEMRAWVFALIVVALLLALLVVYDLLAKKDGQLREARRLESESRQRAERASSQPKEPTLSPRARELTGLIEALERSLERRMKPYPMIEGVDLEPNEQDRFRRICLLTRSTISHTRPVEDALTALEANGLRNVASCLGALDELRARVAAFGERDEDTRPLARGRTTRAILQ
jgi:hypothetical protein